MNQLHFQRVLSCVLFVLFCGELQRCSGFAGTRLSAKQSRPTDASATRRRSFVTMYVPPQTSSQTPAMVAQQMIPNPDSIAPVVRVGERQKKQSKNTNKRRYSTELSNSVLASCNTLPSFPTAHGLLSPETVVRMEEMTNVGGSSEAVSQFLSQYRRHGPMSCLSMLSDPEVLPHLTKAMRDII